MTPTNALHPLPPRRPDCLEFEVRGRMNAADMRGMADAVDAGFKAWGRVDILVWFRPFDGVTLAGAVEPKALKTEAASLAHVRRYAVVGAPGWADALIEAGGGITPVESRTFDQGQIDEARAWLDRPGD